jgi:hypothetical protein
VVSNHQPLFYNACTLPLDHQLHWNLFSLIFLLSYIFGYNSRKIILTPFVFYKTFVGSESRNFLLRRSFTNEPPLPRNILIFNLPLMLHLAIWFQKKIHYKNPSRLEPRTFPLQLLCLTSRLPEHLCYRFLRSSSYSTTWKICRKIAFIYSLFNFYWQKTSWCLPKLRQCLTHVPPDLYKFVTFTFLI